jgi:hypothetical protein
MDTKRRLWVISDGSGDTSGDNIDGGVTSGCGDADGDYPSDGGGNIDCSVGDGDEDMIVAVRAVSKTMKFYVQQIYCFRRVLKLLFECT